MLRDVLPDPRRAVPVEQADDALLVARAVDGDQQAFGVLLRRHGGVLRSYIARLLRRAADVDDVLQETALKAWRKLDSLEDPARVRSWMISIATRTALEHLRRSRDEVELAEEHLVAPGPDADADAREALDVALAALSPQQARVWVLRELGGYAYAEIAEQLGIPESTVRGALAAARRSIIASLGGVR